MVTMAGNMVNNLFALATEVCSPKQGPLLDTEMPLPLELAEFPNQSDNCWVAALNHFYTLADVSNHVTKVVPTTSGIKYYLNAWQEILQTDLFHGYYPAAFAVETGMCQGPFPMQQNGYVRNQTSHPFNFCVSADPVPGEEYFHATVKVDLSRTEARVDKWLCIDDDRMYLSGPPTRVKMASSYHMPQWVESFARFCLELHPVQHRRTLAQSLRDSQCRGAGHSRPEAGHNNESGNSGTIVNNYYMQHYQNSIDLDGISSQNIGEAGAGTNPFSSILDVLGTAGSLALLDQDTEETTRQPDRIVTTLDGNTSRTTQSSVGILRGYNYTPGKHVNPSSAQDTPSKHEQSVECGFTFKLTKWTAVASTWDHLAIPLPMSPGLFKNSGMYKNFVETHYLIKNGWKVQVQSNSSQFHSGCLLVVMVPEYVAEQQRDFRGSWQDKDSDGLPGEWKWQSYDALPRHLPPQQLTLYPHQFLNLRTNTTVDIEVPYMNFVPASAPVMHCPWTLLIMVISPLRYGAGSAPDVQLTMTITPTDFVANGLRQTVSEGIPGTQPYDRQFLSTEPSAPPPLYTPSWLPDRSFIPGKFTDFLQVAVIPTMAEVSVGTNHKPIPSFSVGNTLEDRPLLNTDLTFTSMTFRNTYLSALALNYTQYRGSICVDFLFTGTAMAQGKFVVAYTPPGREPKTLDEAMQGTYAIWDLGLNSSFKFVIPYISASAYRFTNEDDRPSVVNAVGWLQVYQLTTLTYPANTPHLSDIVVFVSAGKDFSLRFPIDTYPRVEGTENMETGAVTPDDPSTTSDARKMPVIHSVSHTNLEFLFDRFFFTGFANVCDVSNNTTHTHSGDTPLNIFSTLHRKLDNSVRDYLLRAFTYFTADLGLAIQPTSTSEKALPPIEYWVGWRPVGAPEPSALVFSTPTPGDKVKVTQRSTVLTGGFCPVVHSVKGQGLNQVQMSIPYTSPLSALPTSYCGYSDYTRPQDTFGVAPAAHFGTLSIRVNARPLTQLKGADDEPLQDLAFALFTRLRNLKAYAPRHFQRVPNSPHKQTDAARTKERTNAIIAEFITKKPINGVAATFETLASNSVKLSNTPVADWENLLSQGATNFDLLKLAGDVESNPGPTIWSMMPGGELIEFATKVSQVYKTLKEKCTDPTTWIKAVRRLLRLLAVVSAWKHGDWFTMICLLVDLGFDLAQLSYKTFWHYLTKPFADAGLKFDFARDLTRRFRREQPRSPETSPEEQRMAYGADFRQAVQYQENLQAPRRSWRERAQDTYRSIRRTFFDDSSSESEDGEPEVPQFRPQVYPRPRSERVVRHPMTARRAQRVIDMGYSDYETAVENPFFISDLSSPEEEEPIPYEQARRQVPRVHFRESRGPEPTLRSRPGLMHRLAQRVHREENQALLSEGISSTLSVLNGFFNLFKNVQWFLDFLKSCYGKLSKQLRPMQSLRDKVLQTYADSIAEFMTPSAQKKEFYLQNHYDAVEAGLNSIAAAWKDLANKCYAYSRPEPVCILLKGRAGQGKSVAATVIAKAVSIVNTGKESVWTLPTDSDFFDGYAGQNVVIIDDLGQNPDGKDFRNFCQMVSSTVFLPPVADLAHKGIPFTSPVIIATTNKNENFLPVTVSDQEAVTRRYWKVIDVSADEQYKTVDGRLDYAKATQPTQIPPELAVFKTHVPLLKGALRDCQRTNRSGARVLNLYDVISAICVEVDRREQLRSNLGGIFAQSRDRYYKRDEDYYNEYGTAEHRRRFVEQNPTFHFKETEADFYERVAFLSGIHGRKQSILKKIKEWFADGVRVRNLLGDAALALSLLTSILSFSLVIYSGVKTYQEFSRKHKHVRQPVYNAWEDFDEDSIFEQSRAYNIPNVRQRLRKQLAVRAENLCPSHDITPDVEAHIPQGPVCEVDPGVPLVAQGASTGLTVNSLSLLNNVVPVTVSTVIETESGPLSQIVSECCGTYLYNKVMIMPRHILTKDWTHITAGRNSATRDQLEAVDVIDQFEMPSDAVAIKFPDKRGSSYKNILHHLAYTLPTRGKPVFILVNNNVAGRAVVHGTYIGCTQKITTLDGFTFPNVSSYKATTHLGMCGAPVVANENGNGKIIGFHCAGTGLVGYASNLTKMSANNICKVWGEPVAQGWTYFDTTHTPVHVPRKTKLKPTVAINTFDCDVEPAVLSKFDSGLEEPDSFELTLLHKNDRRYPEDASMDKHLEAAVEAYASSLFAQIGTDNGPISEYEAVTGIENLDSVETTTSPGLPYTTAGIPREALFDPDKTQLIGPAAERLQEFLRGDFSKHVFQTFLKDELRSKAKVRAGNTRVVEVAAVDHVVAGRMLLGKFTAKMHANNGLGIGSAVGCNPDVDFTRFAYQILDWDYVYDIDYKNFDASHSPKVFQHLKKLLSPANGFDVRVQNYIDSLCYSKHQFGETYYECEGALPSGCSATSILNCLMNNIVLRAAAYDVFTNYEEGDLAFLTYGDDVLLCANQPLPLERFRKSLAKLGYTITPADKSSFFPEVSTLADVVFLKRQFKPDEEFPFLFKPVMDVRNLQDHLCYAKPGTLREKLLSTTDLAVHLGPLEYARLFRPFVEVGYCVRPFGDARRAWLRNFDL
ncbi:polyprotein [Equine rhinitis B virus 2]|uniref:Genome polyprotein n=1 Tax=Equine rhinitis B virus 2 TaxID=168014 RepID=Q91LX8_9PICO|nr:polyprotein [Equine rhinitis B virus 2]